MNRKIFQSSFLTVFLVLVTTIVLILGVLFHFFEQQIQTELENEARFLSQAVENEGIDFFDGFDSQDNRITWVDAKGFVLYDSAAEKDKLDNHAEREEIREAMEKGKGRKRSYKR